MLKEKMKLMGGFLVKNSKMVFPIVLVLAVAVTVLFALNLKDNKRQEELAKELSTQESVGVVEATAEPATEIPLAENIMGQSTGINRFADPVGNADTGSCHVHRHAVRRAAE